MKITLKDLYDFNNKTNLVCGNIQVNTKNGYWHQSKRIKLIINYSI